MSNPIFRYTMLRKSCLAENFPVIDWHDHVQMTVIAANETEAVQTALRASYAPEPEQMWDFKVVSISQIHQEV